MLTGEVAATGINISELGFPQMKVEDIQPQIKSDTLQFDCDEVNTESAVEIIYIEKEDDDDMDDADMAPNTISTETSTQAKVISTSRIDSEHKSKPSKDY